MERTQTIRGNNIGNKMCIEIRGATLSSAPTKNPDFIQRSSYEVRGSARIFRTLSKNANHVCSRTRNLIRGGKKKKADKYASRSKRRERRRDAGDGTGSYKGGEGRSQDNDTTFGSANSRTFNDMTRIVTESQFLVRGVARVTATRNGERSPDDLRSESAIADWGIGAETAMPDPECYS